MKIIIINGQPGVGKDLFVTFAQKNFEDVHNVSTIEYVKEVAKMLGWDGKKDERGRRFLSDIKDALTRYDDVPFKSVVSRINIILGSYEQFEQSTQDCIFFIHCREPQDIEKFVKQFNAKTLLIRRAAVEKKHDNHADNNVMYFDYDYTYNNDYDKKRMEKDVISFINWIKLQSWESDNESLRIWDRSNK